MENYSFENLTDQDRQALILELASTRAEIGEPMYAEEVEFFIHWANNTIDTLRRMVLGGEFDVDVVIEEDKKRVALYRRSPAKQILGEELDKKDDVQ